MRVLTFFHSIETYSVHLRVSFCLRSSVESFLLRGSLESFSLRGSLESVSLGGSLESELFFEVFLSKASLLHSGSFIGCLLAGDSMSPRLAKARARLMAHFGGGQGDGGEACQGDGDEGQVEQVEPEPEAYEVEEEEMKEEGTQDTWTFTQVLDETCPVLERKLESFT